MKHIQNILLAIVGLVLIFTIAHIVTLKDRITTLETRDYTDVSSSTINVQTGTSTEKVTLTSVVNFVGLLASEVICIKSPNTEGCPTASTTQVK